MDKINDDLNETEGTSGIGMLNSRLGYPFFSSNLNHETKFSWEIVNTSAKWVNELVLHTGNFAVGSSFSIGLVDYRWGSKKRSWRKKQ